MAEERILVVDDEPGVRAALEGILADEGFRVTSAESGEVGLEILRREPYDAVLLDVWLPGMDGLETLTKLREHGADVEVVMISGHGTIETAVRATKLGAFDFVEKPLSLEKTLVVLRNALRQRRLERRNRQLLAQLSRDTEILGRSAAAELLRQQVSVAAGASAPVLICGEPGTGRETVARRIHTASEFSDGPFVDVPCGALESAAAASALYGQDDKPGRIELAAGGSLFLEDVDRLEPAAQRRLAGRLSGRTRQDRLPRLIASTRPDPNALEPSLRQLLEVVPIRTPALRERREDIASFAERFMRDLAREYGVQPKRWAPDCLTALKAYHWPGNVRELHNLIERTLLSAPGDVVQMHDLPEGLGGAGPPVEDLYREFASLDDGLKAFERYYVTRMLAEENSDREAAATRLGLTLDGLDQRLKRL